MSEDVSIRARFERFPATVKGAFVVRGESRDPHQVAFRGARVVRVPGTVSRDIPVDQVTLDCPPHKDLFVPFEFPIGDLEPAWYDLEAEVDIDGVPRTVSGGKRFSVPWPRSAVRSASLKVDRSVQVGETTVSVERCQSGQEGLTLRFSVDPPGPVSLRLAADGGRIDVVEQEVDASGKGVARAYPLLRSHAELRIQVSGKSRGESGQIEVELPG